MFPAVRYNLPYSRYTYSEHIVSINILYIMTISGGMYFGIFQ
jgi:hypothetical protein